MPISSWRKFGKLFDHRGSFLHFLSSSNDFSRTIDMIKVISIVESNFPTDKNIYGVSPVTCPFVRSTGKTRHCRRGGSHTRCVRADTDLSAKGREREREKRGTTGSHPSDLKIRSNLAGVSRLIEIQRKLSNVYILLL